MNLPEPVRQGLTQVVGAAVGAVAGGTAGAATSLNQTAHNYVSHSPFAGVRCTVSQENARLTTACGSSCTAQDFQRIDQQMAALGRAGTAARTGDAQTGIGQIFGKERVKDEVGAQVAITKAFGQQAATAIGMYAAGQLQEAEKKQTAGKVAQQRADKARAEGRDQDAQALQTQADTTFADANRLRQQ